MLTPIYERKFIKDIEVSKKRGKDMKKLMHVITLLLEEEPLPVKYRNHKLKGEFRDCYECHIEPDWLLIYKKTLDEIILMRIGTHADLF